MQYRRIDRVLAITSFIAQFTIAMVNFSLVYFLRDIHQFSSSEIGIASSVYTLFYFIFCMVFGKIFGEKSKRGKIVISLWGMAISILGILLSSNRLIVYLSLSFYGITMAFLWPNVEAWITDGKEGGELSLSVSRFNFSWSFGAGLSTAAGGFLAELGVSLPLASAIALFFISGVLIMMQREEKSEGADESIEVEDHSTPLRFLCWIGVTMMYIGYSLIITIFPLYASAELGFSEALTGNLLLFRGITACIAFVVLGRTSFWQFKASVIFAVQCSFVVLALIMSFIEKPIIFAPFFVVFGIVFSLSYVLSIFHGASGAKDRSKRMMIHEVLLTVGTVIGSLFGGIIYDNFSFNTVLYAIALSGIAVILVELVIYKVKLR